MIERNSHTEVNERTSLAARGQDEAHDDPSAAARGWGTAHDDPSATARGWGKAHNETPFEWACPVCRGALRVNAEIAGCRSCGMNYECQEGIWDFLPSRRADVFKTFIEQYDIVRRGEKWGRAESEYYRNLPDVPFDDPQQPIWQLRRRSFHTFVRRVLAPLEVRAGRPLTAIDLGAGNGWLAYHLARRGHHLAAVDLRTDELDGLGAHVHYDAGFTPVRAEFERLPFATAQFDLAIFNGSFHYATDCEATLHEAFRVLRPGGRLIILDSPVYRSDRSGREMVRERERAFLARFGFASNALESEHFMTEERLNELASATGIPWELFRPFYGLKWTLRPLAALVLRRRVPAGFPVMAATRPAHFVEQETDPASPVSAGPGYGGAKRTLSPAAAYDRWAASYRSRTNPLQELEEEALNRLLPDLHGKAVLDVGCGTGRVSRMAVERGGASTVGVDPSGEMLKQARSHTTDSSDWIAGDACALPFDSSTFDVVICALVLGHVERLGDALSEMNRVLKAGGTVVISGFHPFAALRGHERTFEDPSSGQTFAITQHVHLFTDYFRCFREHEWVLEAFEEPTYEGFPVVFILRARKGAEKEGRA